MQLLKFVAFIWQLRGCYREITQNGTPSLTLQSISSLQSTQIFIDATFRLSNYRAKCFNQDLFNFRPFTYIKYTRLSQMKILSILI